VYVAAVVDGAELSGYRTAMRECVLDIAPGYERALRDYDGNAEIFAAVEPRLRAPLVGTTFEALFRCVAGLTRHRQTPQARFIPGFVVVTVSDNGAGSAPEDQDGPST